ncbi:hypothetical protein J4E91_002880 [Alternaria rosae]|nr:hypothetical protein J4E91_002880 [Alternaria rosae]
MDDGSASFAQARMNANLEIASRAREAEPPNMALSRLATNMAYLLFKDYLKRMNQEDKEEQEREQTARAEAEETRRLQSFWNRLRPAARDRAFRRAFLRAKLQDRRR